MSTRYCCLTLLLIPVLLSTACGPAPGTLRLDPMDLSLLRLAYLERAEQLPALAIDRVDLPRDERVGSFSPLLWRVRAASLHRPELLRPLPYRDPDLRLRDGLAHTFEGFGFMTEGWTSPPPLRLRVEVQRLVLLTEDGDADLRACDLELVFHIEDYPLGLELRSFSTRARVELPGSWLALREGFAAWAPRPGEPDPLDAAVAQAAEGFLAQSLSFWERPANWREGMISLTRGETPARPATPPIRTASR